MGVDVFLCFSFIPFSCVCDFCFHLAYIYLYFHVCTFRCSWFLFMHYILAFNFNALVTPLPFSALWGGFLLLVLLLLWFRIGVTYVYNIFSYVLGRCNGWLPMHFTEMKHLPYGQSCIPISRGDLPFSLDQFFKLLVLVPLYLQVPGVCLCFPSNSSSFIEGSHTNYFLLDPDH